MTQPTDYGRRDFLKFAAMLGVSLAVPKSVESPLEANVAEAAQKIKPKTEEEIKMALYNIASKIADVADKPNAGDKLSPIAYNIIYKTYNQAISESKELCSGLSWKDKLTVSCKGLESIALMQQADMLRGAFYNVVPEGERVSIYGLPPVASQGSSSKVFNNLKAFANYMEVARIWEEAAKNKREFPQNINVYPLGKYGRIERPFVIYQKMGSTIDWLLDNPARSNFPKKYHKFLKTKKGEVEQKLKAFDNKHSPRKILRALATSIS